jgi:hypothetical protein
METESKIFDTSLIPSSNSLVSFEALKNAVKMWLFSSKGDYIGKPFKGGPLSGIMGKPMLEGMDVALYQKIRQGLEIDFKSEELKITHLTVVSDFENRKWEVSLAFYSNRLKVGVFLEESVPGA